MRIAYLDCFAGISGDMLLGALIDSGVPPSVLLEATAALNLGATLSITKVDRSGISSTKVDVIEGVAAVAAPPAQVAEATTTSVAPPPIPARSNRPVYAPLSPFDHQREDFREPATPQPQTQHEHKLPNDQPHTHDEPAHTHGRSLTAIRKLITGAALSEPVKQTALRAFSLLGNAEAAIHNVPVDEIHFHEVGAVDAIVDIVAASAGLHHLNIGAWFCSPLNVGGGMVDCAHGTFPVPAPATADLLRFVPTYSAHVQMELVTPTGAAIVRALDPTFGPQPPMRVESIGYGAGSRNPTNFPNVLRLQVGESDAVAAGTEEPTQTVTILETALDDLSPQLLAHVAERALAEGALDVMLTPVIMKKGRPGTLLTLIANPADQQKFEQMLLRETSTLGVRSRQDRRSCLDRSFTTVETPYGPIRMKLGTSNGETLNAAPEFEDCRAAALEHGVPVKQVQQAATAAYLR
jgi:uncharacterized protein (TIGR00299 family) protein